MKKQRRPMRTQFIAFAPTWVVAFFFEKQRRHNE